MNVFGLGSRDLGAIGPVAISSYWHGHNNPLYAPFRAENGHKLLTVGVKSLCEVVSRVLVNPRGGRHGPRDLVVGMDADFARCQPQGERHAFGMHA